MLGILRFDDKIMPIPECGCWIWMGAVSGNGYGSIKYCGVAIGAHMFAYRMYYKKRIPRGFKLRHSCDTPLCCNPHHLKAGTHSRNMRDMMERGRGRGQFTKASA